MFFSQIAEPVRFVVETKVRIYPATERFWYYTKRTVVRRYRLVVRRMEDGGDGLQLVEVVAGEEVAQPQQVMVSVCNCNRQATVKLREGSSTALITISTLRAASPR